MIWPHYLVAMQTLQFPREEQFMASIPPNFLLFFQKKRYLRHISLSYITGTYLHIYCAINTFYVFQHSGAFCPMKISTFVIL